MSKDSFSFKKFTIQHNNCAMKVSTDACLLGAWAQHENPRICLDIGAGSGIIALMIAQRYADATIDAVEIETNCAKQCQENIDNSPWGDRMTVHQTNVLRFKPNATYDLIVSNPPYFDQAVLPEARQKQLARHQLALNLEKLMAYAATHLNTTGNFCLILPKESYFKAALYAKKNSLWLIKKSDLRTLPQKEISRVLLNFSKTPLDYTENEILIAEQPGKYHKDFTDLLQEFYLNF